MTSFRDDPYDAKKGKKTWRDVSFVSVVSDGDDPLGPEPPGRVHDDDWHDDDQADEAGPHHVDDQGLLEHVRGVSWTQGVNPGEGRGCVEAGVEKVRHPVCVRDAGVVVDVDNVCGVRK